MTQSVILSTTVATSIYSTQGPAHCLYTPRWSECYYNSRHGNGTKKPRAPDMFWLGLNRNWCVNFFQPMSLSFHDDENILQINEPHLYHQEWKTSFEFLFQERREWTYASSMQPSTSDSHHYSLSFLVLP